MKRSSPLTLLNVAQFCSAINDNLFKLLAAFFLIQHLGTVHTNTIMALVGGLFMLPFLLFSTLGGILGDKYSKSQVTLITRYFEVFFMVSGFFIFLFHITHYAYVILFLTATTSAIFGPSKYGMIPEIVPTSKIVHANSVIAAFTFLGIIIGTTLASFTTWATRSHFFIAQITCVLIAVFGLSASIYLPKTPVENKEKKFSWLFYQEIGKSMREMKQIPSLLEAMIIYSYFLFIGGFAQLNVIPYTLENTSFSEYVGGYFFLLTALGLGLGSFVTEKITKDKLYLGIIPISGFAISVILFLTTYISKPWPIIGFWMILVGFFGGLFLVPAQTFISYKSPKESRGANFATANFLSFGFALLASIMLYILNVLLRLSSNQSFFVIGAINFFVMFYYTVKTKWIQSKPIPLDGEK